MGTFDEVWCHHDLFGAHKGEKHQTRSLNLMGGGAFEQYEITPAGRLELLEYVIEDRSDPNAEGIDRILGSATMLLTGSSRDMNYPGWLSLSAFGRAKFTDGMLVAFEAEAIRDLGTEESSVELRVADQRDADNGIARESSALQESAEETRARQAGKRRLVEPDARKATVKVGKLIDRLREFDLNAEIYLQIDSRRFAPPLWVGIMDTAGLFDDEKDFQLVISAWEPAACLRGPEN